MRGAIRPEGVKSAREFQPRPTTDIAGARTWAGWNSPLSVSHPILDASAAAPSQERPASPPCLPKWPGWKSPALTRASDEENNPRKDICIELLGECTVTCGGRALQLKPQLVLDKESRTCAHDSHATISVDFMLPNGVEAGDKVAILHEGRPYCFNVPDGARAGDNVSTVLQNKGDSLACLNVEITVPSGYSAGDIVGFRHKGHRYEVAVPKGLSCGEKFMADVSPPTIVYANDRSKPTTDSLALHNDPLAMHSTKDTERDCESLPTKSSTPKMMRSAPPPVGNELVAPSNLVTQECELGADRPDERNKLSYGVGIQFEYDRSSGALCKWTEPACTFGGSGV